MKRRDKLPEGRLGEMLSAAGAPGRRHELRGEEDAVAGFRQEYRPRNAPARPRRKRRLFAVALTALVAIGIGGTAFAAGTGRLPDPVQTWFDTHRPAATDSSPTSTKSAPQSRGASPSPHPSSTTPVESCRAWSERDDRPVTEEVRQELLRLAGGEAAIDGYCHRVLGTASPSPSSKPSASPSATGQNAPSSGDRIGEDDQGEDEDN